MVESRIGNAASLDPPRAVGQGYQYSWSQISLIAIVLYTVYQAMGWVCQASEPCRVTFMGFGTTAIDWVMES